MREHEEWLLKYMRHGQIPFFGLPMADPAKASGAYDNVTSVLMGVTYDGGTTYAPGARFAPYTIRRASALVPSFDPVRRVRVFDQLRAIDGGNVAAPMHDPAAVRDRIEAEIAAILAAGATPYLVGGDHSVALPAMRAVAGRFGPLAVVHVDAHADTGSYSFGDEFHHGTPLRHALDEGLIARGQLHQIAVRQWDDRPEDEGIQQYSVDAVASRGADAVMTDVRAAIGDRPVYLTFDIDGVDPAFAPGTGTPVPGGLSSREALAVVRGLAGLHLVGMDLVEVLPAQDHHDLTSLLAAHLLMAGLCVQAARPPGVPARAGATSQRPIARLARR